MGLIFKKILTNKVCCLQIWDLNAHHDVPVLVLLNGTVRARWFRLMPVSINNRAHLTMELYGLPSG